MRLTRGVIALLLLALPATALAWNEPEGFRNVKWGTPVDEAKRLLSLPADTSACGPLSCFFPSKVGPVEVDTYLMFRNGGLARVALWFDAKVHETLRTIFVDRYGPPTGRSEEPIQTPGGGLFTNEILRWEGTGAVVTLRRFGDKVTRGEAVIQTAANRAEELARLGNAIKKGKDDL